MARASAKKVLTRPRSKAASKKPFFKALTHATLAKHDQGSRSDDNSDAAEQDILPPAAKRQRGSSSNAVICYKCEAAFSEEVPWAKTKKDKAGLVSGVGNRCLKCNNIYMLGDFDEKGTFEKVSDMCATDERVASLWSVAIKVVDNGCASDFWKSQAFREESYGVSIREDMRGLSLAEFSREFDGKKPADLDLKCCDLPDARGSTYKGVLLRDDKDVGKKYTVFRKISGNLQEFKMHLDKCVHPEQGSWNLTHLQNHINQNSKFKKIFSCKVPNISAAHHRAGECDSERPPREDVEAASGSDEDEEPEVIEHGACKPVTSNEAAVNMTKARTGESLARKSSPTASVYGADMKSFKSVVLAGKSPSDGDAFSQRSTPKKYGPAQVGETTRLRERMDAIDLYKILVGRASPGRELRFGREYLAELDARKDLKAQADILRLHIKKGMTAQNLVPEKLKTLPMKELVADMDFVTQKGTMELPPETKVTLVDRALSDLAEYPIKTDVVLSMMIRMEPFHYADNEAIPIPSAVANLYIKTRETADVLGSSAEEDECVTDELTLVSAFKYTSPKAAYVEASPADACSYYRARLLAYVFKAVIGASTDIDLTTELLEFVEKRYANLPHSIPDCYVEVISEVLVCVRGVLGLLDPLRLDLLDDVARLTHRKQSLNATSLLGGVYAQLSASDTLASMVRDFSTKSTPTVRVLGKRIAAVSQKLAEPKNVTISDLLDLLNQLDTWRSSLPAGSTKGVEQTILSCVEYQAILFVDIMKEPLTGKTADQCSQFQKLCETAQASKITGAHLPRTCIQAYNIAKENAGNVVDVKNMESLRDKTLELLAMDTDIIMEKLSEIKDCAVPCSGILLPDDSSKKVMELYKRVIENSITATGPLSKLPLECDLANELLCAVLALRSLKFQEAQQAQVQKCLEVVTIIEKFMSFASHYKSYLDFGENTEERVAPTLPKCLKICEVHAQWMEFKRFYKDTIGDWHLKSLLELTLPWAVEVKAAIAEALKVSTHDLHAKMDKVNKFVDMSKGTDWWYEGLEIEDVSFADLVEHAKTTLLQIPGAKFDGALTEMDIARKDLVALNETFEKPVDADLIKGIAEMLAKGITYKSLGLFMFRFNKDPASLVNLRRIGTKERQALLDAGVYETHLPLIVRQAFDSACALKRIA